jgi:hypothetical protein
VSRSVTLKRRENDDAQPGLGLGFAPPSFLNSSSFLDTPSRKSACEHTHSTSSPSPFPLFFSFDPAHSAGCDDSRQRVLAHHTPSLLPPFFGGSREGASTRAPPTREESLEMSPRSSAIHIVVPLRKTIELSFLLTECPEQRGTALPFLSSPFPPLSPPSRPPSPPRNTVEEREREGERERGSTWGRWEKEPHPTGFVRFGGSEESEEESSDDHTFFLRFFFKGRDCSRERRKEYVTHRRSAPECPRMGNSVGKRCAPLFFPFFFGRKTVACLACTSRGLLRA